jgi:hypothetical protein
MIKYLLAIAVGIILAASANAQWGGTISSPDIFGEQHIRFNNGGGAVLSSPDIFGERTLRYNNGATIQYSSPDIFGERHFQQTTMPRSSWRGW